MRKLPRLAQPVLSSQGYASDGSLGGAIVDFDRAVVEISPEGCPSSQGIAHCRGHLCRGGEPGQGCFDPCLQGVKTRSRLVLSNTPALIGWFATDGVFNTVEGADAIKGFRGRGGWIVDMLVEELAPDMRPAGGLGGLACLEDGIEPGIAVGMQHAGEVLEVFLWMLALAVGRVEVYRSRRLD